METIVVVLGMLGAFLLGSWVTYRAMQNKSPVQMPQFIKDMVDDLPGPISPYEQEQKSANVRVKL